MSEHLVLGGGGAIPRGKQDGTSQLISPAVAALDFLPAGLRLGRRDAVAAVALEDLD
jgi:hypothetical protein